MKKMLSIMFFLGITILAGCISNEETLEGLTEEQKEEYYNQYVKILADLKLEYPSVEMEITPLDEFLDENWIEPEELKEKLVDFLKNGEVVYK